MSEPVPIDRPRRARAATDARVPPHNLEAEESLLGAMMLRRDAIATAVEANVGPEDFYRPANGHIFEAIVDLYARGEPADAVTVSDELGRQPDRLESIGGASTLISLMSATPAISNAGRYAAIVADMATLRRLIASCTDIAANAYEEPTDIAQALDDAEASLFALRPQREAATARTLRDGLEDWLNTVEALNETGGMVEHPTGFRDLDDLTGGLHAHLIVVAARPGAGKTSWAGQLVANVAGQGRPALFMSIEMSYSELVGRFVASESGLVGSQISRGRVAPKDWDRIAGAVKTLVTYPVEIVDSPTTTLLSVRTAARRATARLGPLALIVVDYVQLMTGRRTAENRQVEVAELARGLKVLAKELGVPVVALAQLNRGVEQRSDKRPTLADLRETGELENSADTVMAIYRDEMYDKKTEDRGVAELILLKNRHGPTGTVKVAADMTSGRWSNLAQGSY